MHTGNVLIVDDDADIREMICLFVPRLGLEPTAVASGAAFRAAYERKTPDVVVLDIVLPGENGIDLLRWLAARGCRARVVVISGLASIHGPEARRVAEEVGIDIAVLEKPFHMRDLGSAIMAAPKRPERTDRPGGGVCRIEAAPTRTGRAPGGRRSRSAEVGPEKGERARERQFGRGLVVGRLAEAVETMIGA